MELDEARALFDAVRRGEAAPSPDELQEATALVLVHLDNIERRCQQVIGGYMPHRQSVEIARFIATGSAT